MDIRRNIDLDYDYVIAYSIPSFAIPTGDIDLDVVSN